MKEIVTWTNQNSGFLSILLFFAALTLGWVSGLFRMLRNRPKLKIRLIDGPTMVSTFETGRELGGHPAHRTAIALYLDIANIGSAATDIDKIQVGYHNHTVKFSYFWFWIKERAVALSDFMTPIGESMKVYPFLDQVSTIAPNHSDRFLVVGKRINGVVYFEQDESWGGFQPRVNSGYTKVKIRIIDTFGGSHTRIDRIPVLSLEKAREYNENFGQTFETLRKAKETEAEQTD